MSDIVDSIILVATVLAGLIFLVVLIDLLTSGWFKWRRKN
jgi:hypothetical protein